MAARITSASGTDTGVNVGVNGGEKFLSWLWLRDHSQEPDAFHQKARQRLLETFNIGAVGPGERGEVAEDGGKLTVHWPNGSVSRFTADYLAAINAPEKLYDVVGSDQ